MNQLKITHSVEVAPGVFREAADDVRSFRHRVRVGGKAGEWMSYQGIATVHANGNWYAAVTEFYAGCPPFVGSDQAVYIVQMVGDVKGDQS